jgi:putative membrane protein insertion efficiency factor
VRPRELLVAVVRLYQRALSPLFGDTCRFHPSCSHYMIGTLKENGALVGLLDGTLRLLRCHPFHPGGLDEPRRIHIFPLRNPWKRG